MMNEKKWGETLNCLKGNTYDIHEFENDVISLCETENVIYIGDFEKVPYHSTEWVRKRRQLHFVRSCKR